MTSGASNIPPDKPGFDNIQPTPKPLKKPDQEQMQNISEGMHQFAGMNFTKQQWARFLTQMMSMMMSQIKADNDRMIAAIKKLREQQQ